MLWPCMHAGKATWVANKVLIGWESARVVQKSHDWASAIRATVVRLIIDGHGLYVGSSCPECVWWGYRVSRVAGLNVLSILMNLNRAIAL